MARFMRKGKTKVYFVPTISNKAAPTVAEITAGTVLTASIAEMNGFTFSNNPIDTPDMSTAFVNKIPGEDSVDDSNIVFYEDDTTDTLRTSQAKGTNGYIVTFPKGTAGASPAAADKAEVWPVTIASNSRQYTADNEAAKFQVVYAITAPPVEATVAA
jgi:hypothetical protein